MTVKSILIFLAIVSFLAVFWYQTEPFVQQLNNISFKSAEQQASITSSKSEHNDTQEEIGRKQIVLSKEMLKQPIWQILWVILILMPCLGMGNLLFQKVRTSLKSRKLPPNTDSKENL